MRQIVPLKNLICQLIYLIYENKLPLTMVNHQKNKAPLSCAKTGLTGRIKRTNLSLVKQCRGQVKFGAMTQTLNSKYT
jgi:hypothetical protein